MTLFFAHLVMALKPSSAKYFSLTNLESEGTHMAHEIQSFQIEYRIVRIRVRNVGLEIENINIVMLRHINCLNINTNFQQQCTSHLFA